MGEMETLTTICLPVLSCLTLTKAVKTCIKQFGPLLTPVGYREMFVLYWQDTQTDLLPLQHTHEM